MNLWDISYDKVKKEGGVEVSSKFINLPFQTKYLIIFQKNETLMASYQKFEMKILNKQMNKEKY